MQGTECLQQVTQSTQFQLVHGTGDYFLTVQLQGEPLHICRSSGGSGWCTYSSSSSNNIQDQCLIITDLYGVREKGYVAGNQYLTLTL